MVRLANDVSFAVLGLLVAAAWRVPLALLIVVGALFGLSDGYENGRAITPETAGHLFVLGVAAIGAVATAWVGAATIAAAGQAAWPRIAVRIAGSCVAAIGIMMIGLSWRPT